ncbi:hypothetical protein PUN28_020835 [Cardiocondyla obscurior]|uniref:Uncharacterized protein n=1 Tax=Cardiocondyla obscurior TaxID=286306 RepID=A0AAW2E6M3_9HYME
MPSEESDVPDEQRQVMPARRSVSPNPHTSAGLPKPQPPGVYENAGSVFAKYRRHNGTTSFQQVVDLSFSLFLGVVSILNDEEIPPSSPPGEVEEEVGALTKELFGPDLQKKDLPS